MKKQITLGLVIEKTDEGFHDLLNSVEKLTEYLSLQKKDALHVRLLAEELAGISAALFEGDISELSIKNESGGVTLTLTVEAISAGTARQKLVDIAGGGKNAAYSGFTGMIRRVLDDMGAAAEANPYGPSSGNPECDGMIYQGGCYEWSFERYKQEAELEKKAREYDSYELSVLNRLSDDIVVSARPHFISITVKYIFKNS